MNVVSKTDKGIVRRTNQDSVKTLVFDDWCLSVICDGIGGTAGGDIASNIASNFICDHFNKFKSEDIKEMMFESFALANEEILKVARENVNFSELGTTCVAAFVSSNGSVHISNVGDSRAYIISKSYIKQITEDHSIVNQLVMEGKITPEQAKSAPNKNIITRALGCRNSNPDYYNLSMKKGSKILLCTDGLSNHVSDDEIYDIVSKNSPSKSLEVMIDKANSSGGTDNITVSIIF